MIVNRKLMPLGFGLLLLIPVYLSAQAEKLSFSIPSEMPSRMIQCNQQPVVYPIQSFFILPGETIEINVVNEKSFRSPMIIMCNKEKLEPKLPGYWQWKAPSRPGCYEAKLSYPEMSQVVQLNFLVMVPYSTLTKGKLHGYHIGRYPKPFQKSAGVTYDYPKGFIQVTPDLVNLKLTPHFELGQFLCKQSGGFPKFIVLEDSLLIKLENLLSEVNRQIGYYPTFKIISGYRTPYYNRQIGNVPYSSHLYGRAADIALESSKSITQKQALLAKRLYQVAVHVDDQLINGNLPGGLSYYPENHRRGPFIHVDCRGERTRWGQMAASALPEKP